MQVIAMERAVIKSIRSSHKLTGLPLFWACQLLSLCTTYWSIWWMTSKCCSQNCYPAKVSSLAISFFSLFPTQHFNKLPSNLFQIRNAIFWLFSPGKWNSTTFQVLYHNYSVIQKVGYKRIKTVCRNSKEKCIFSSPDGHAIQNSLAFTKALINIFKLL